MKSNGDSSSSDFVAWGTPSTLNTLSTVNWRRGQSDPMQGGATQEGRQQGRRGRHHHQQQQHQQLQDQWVRRPNEQRSRAASRDSNSSNSSVSTDASTASRGRPSSRPERRPDPLAKNGAGRGGGRGSGRGVGGVGPWAGPPEGSLLMASDPSRPASRQTRSSRSSDEPTGFGRGIVPGPRREEQSQTEDDVHGSTRDLSNVMDLPPAPPGALTLQRSLSDRARGSLLTGLEDDLPPDTPALTRELSDRAKGLFRSLPP